MWLRQLVFSAGNIIQPAPRLTWKKENLGWFMLHALHVPLSTGRVNDCVCNPLLGRSSSEKVVSKRTIPSFKQDLFENKNGILQIPFLVGSAGIFCR